MRSVASPRNDRKPKTSVNVVMMTPEAMAGVGFSAPLHAGAERFYQERGLR